MTTEHKTLTATIKQAGDAGEFEAVIATLNVIDSDGDIVMPGCLDGKTLTLLPAHESWHVPLGKATIEERETSGVLEAVAVGKFNLEVRAARDWHSAVKFDLAHPPSLQEYSWDLFPTDARPDQVNGQDVRRLYAVDSKEMSLVLRGASVNTRTISAKSFRAHKTETSDAPWDLVANLRRAKSADRFLHHFTDADGKEGAASTRACFLGIAALNGATGEAFSDPVYRKGMYEHLAAHLADAGAEAPALTDADDPPGLKLVDQVRFAGWQAEAAVARLREVSASRSKSKRGLSEDAAQEAIEMAAVLGEMAKLAGQVSALVSSHKLDAPEGDVRVALAALNAERLTEARKSVP